MKTAQIIKTRPITLNTLEVKAVLNTNPDLTPINPNKPIKYQKRYVVKPTQSTPKVAPLELEPWIINGEREVDNNGSPCWIGKHPDYSTSQKWFSCDYGKIGDRLWVAETFSGDKNYIEYKANDAYYFNRSFPKWKPSSRMPKWASRITLEITDVRVERLQDITPSNIKAEGFGVYEESYLINPTTWMDKAIYLDQWVKRWNEANAKRGYGWETNPYVWVIEFKRVETTK